MAFQTDDPGDRDGDTQRFNEAKTRAAAMAEELCDAAANVHCQAKHGENFCEIPEGGYEHNVKARKMSKKELLRHLQANIDREVGRHGRGKGKNTGAAMDAQDRAAPWSTVEADHFNRNKDNPKFKSGYFIRVKALCSGTCIY